MSGQASVEKQYDTLYNDVKQFFKNSTSGKLTVASVTVLTRYSMELVQTGENWQGMKGSEKKDLVFGVISALVTDLLDDPQVVGKNFSDDTRQGILAAVGLVPMIVDAVVDFAKTYSQQNPAPVSGSNSGSSGRKRFFCCMGGA
jgi:hypothetical protein